MLRRRRLTKAESKKGVGLIETELARSGSETSDAAAAARSGRDMEDVGASCIVGTVRGEDYNFQVCPNASALACCCTLCTWAILEGGSQLLGGLTLTVCHFAGGPLHSVGCGHGEGGHCSFQVGYTTGLLHLALLHICALRAYSEGGMQMLGWFAASNHVAAPVQG